MLLNSKKISIVIPAYNEEKRIKKTLLKYIDFFDNNFKDKFEIIVVGNGCTDNTESIVNSLAKEFDCIRFLNFKEKLGKGGAIIQGFKVANADIIGFLDADGSTLPESILKLISIINGYDGVIASRWINGAVIGKKQPLARRIASRGFNILVRVLFGLKYLDTQCGAKFFKGEAVKRVLPELGLTDWSFDVDLLYRLSRKGYRIKEVPITWNNVGDSKLNLRKTPIKMFLSIVGLRVKVSPKLAPLANYRIIKQLYRKVKDI